MATEDREASDWLTQYLDEVMPAVWDGSEPIVADYPLDRGLAETVRRLRSLDAAFALEPVRRQQIWEELAENPDRAALGARPAWPGVASATNGRRPAARSCAAAPWPGRAHWRTLADPLATVSLLVLLVLVGVVALGKPFLPGMTGSPAGTIAGTECRREVRSAGQVLRGTPHAGATRPTGAHPVLLRIKQAGVNATIEVTRIVDGVLENPSDPEVVGWYEATGTLGSGGNVVLAGYAGGSGYASPVFQQLEHLAVGDAVEVTGENGELYPYAVEWVRTFQAAELTGVALAAIIGPTADEAVTLIGIGGTGGDLQRTVVRATCS